MKSRSGMLALVAAAALGQALAIDRGRKIIVDPGPKEPKPAPLPAGPMTRQQRRAAERAARKSRRPSG